MLVISTCWTSAQYTTSTPFFVKSRGRICGHDEHPVGYVLAPSKIGLIKKENASFITDIIIFLRIAGLIKTKDDSGIHCSKAGEAPV